MSDGSRPRVAVVGSGVAGLTAAWIISKSAQVTLFEADTRLGGHADTHDVRVGQREIAVDTGFIVHNEQTYPVLLRLFDELSVTTRPSEMSLSIRDDATGIQWAGALGVRGLFPSPRMLGRAEHLQMLREIPRFHRRAKRLIRSSDGAQTLDEFLAAGGFSDHFRRHFMEPMVAAVWSCDPAIALEYPASYLFRFLDHHGMLRVFGSPQWRTIVGGSRTYVERVAAAVHDVRRGTKVTTVVELDGRVAITDGNGATDLFDAAVIATHPSQALDLLGAPTPAQREVLSALPYSSSDALLHTDTSLLPTARNARAAWNFLRREEPDEGLTVTYDLSRLQGLDTAEPLLLTLGGSDLVDPDRVVERIEYEHPIYTPQSVAAQGRLPAINSAQVAFAGAYHGWGFHEDGARSGLAAAEHLGFSWGPQPGVFRTTIRHTRRAPVTRTFQNRSHVWVVDLDALPDHGRRAFALGRFESRDHLGDPQRSLRENVEAFLAASAIRWTAAGSCWRPSHGLGGTASTRSACSGASTPPARSPRRSSRCTTPTATGTPTSCTPTTAAARKSKRPCTSRRSTALTARTRSRLRCPTIACTSRSRCAATTARCSALRWSAPRHPTRDGAPPSRPCAGRSSSGPTASGCGSDVCRSSRGPRTSNRE